MKTLKSGCKPRSSVFDSARRDTVLDLSDLVQDRIDPAEFFAENYTTEGMKILLTEAFRRLEGKSEQGIFKLTQAMGGGKTHNLLALGLLAKHPGFRTSVMSSFYSPGKELGSVRVVAFSGRESDAPYGIWGAIADQLGKRDLFKDYYTPLSAPGQSAWINLLKGDPVVIMVDELPPYFVNAKAKAVGNSDLSVVTATALSNLLVALGKEELKNCVLVITDLTTSYQAGTQQIVSALSDLQRETGRSAMDLEPVRMNTDEFYQILRKRIFEALPPKEDIAEVAQGYAKAVRDARQMDVTNASPEQFAQRIVESYPFHPAIRDLYARFKENPGFQQTRGLIRLMRIVTARLWQKGAENRYLVAAHDVDLNDRETLTEVNQINPTLESAIAHDIASNGQAVAEIMDANLDGSDSGDVARLLLVSSLANIPGATRGLAIPEIIANLCAPGRDVSKLKNEVIGRFLTAAWYLHTTGEGRLFFRNVQNLVARLKTTADAYLRDQSIRELKGQLSEMFKPEAGWCYQRLEVLPPIDELDITQDRVTLVITEPHAQGLHPDLKSYFEQLTFRNRICFLTGQRNFDALLNSAKELKAINQIIAELIAEGTPDQDPQIVQARDLLDRIRTQFLSATRETFTTLHFPVSDRLMTADFLMEFTSNRYHGEEQVAKTLQAKQKYTDDIAGDTFRQKCEQRLFTQKAMLWSEIKRRAAMNPAWQWHKADALDKLKEDCVHKELWRESGAYVEKGPFPLPDTSVKVQVLNRDLETGHCKLRVTPINADILFAEVGGKATTASHKLDGRDYATGALEVSFLAMDSGGKYNTGDPVPWRNTITLRSRVYHSGDDKMLELRAAPPAAIRYTTDGSEPRSFGATYEAPFVIPKSTRLVLAAAEKNGVQSDVLRVDIDWNEQPGERPIDREKPALWRPQHGFELSTTRASYGFIARLRQFEAEAGSVSIRILGTQWVEFALEDSIRVNGARMEQAVEYLRSFVAEGEVNLVARYVAFPTGQQLLDYVEEVKATLVRDEVQQ
ncbi:MAG: DUF499 domain-containing protein [Betaproteobacteria bacterium]|nr:DUF499 domain-containing protein [Betaproteobacteria bacterium]